MDESSPELQALRQAVESVGGQAALARLCDVAQPSVWGWLNKVGRLPAEHVLKVEAATGVAKEDLRPDIYPRDAGASTASGVGAAGGAGGLVSTGPARANPAPPEPLSGLTA